MNAAGAELNLYIICLRRALFLCVWCECVYQCGPGRATCFKTHRVVLTASRVGKTGGSSRLGCVSHIRQEIRTWAHVETENDSSDEETESQVLQHLISSTKETDTCDSDFLIFMSPQLNLKKQNKKIIICFPRHS